MKQSSLGLSNTVILRFRHLLERHKLAEQILATVNALLQAKGLQLKAGIRYSERLAEAGIEPSVGSKGDSYDNALAETINGLYKAELIHRRAPWKSKEAVELATLEWVAWFNHHRLLEPIGYS